MWAVERTNNKPIFEKFSWSKKQLIETFPERVKQVVSEKHEKVIAFVLFLHYQESDKKIKIDCIPTEKFSARLKAVGWTLDANSQDGSFKNLVLSSNTKICN